MGTNKTRRDFLKKVAYTAPVIMTLPAITAHARTGSSYQRCNNGVGNGPEGCNPGNAPNNDEIFKPGSPGMKGGVKEGMKGQTKGPKH